MSTAVEKGFYPALTGFGGELGGICHTNDDVRDLLSIPDKVSEETIRRICGIEQRYYAEEHVLPSHMGIAAAKLALRSAAISPADVAYFKLSTNTPNNIIPATAYAIHKGVELPETTGAADIHKACAGAVDALETVCALMIANDEPTGLVVAAELHSPGLDDKEWQNSILFGDGAGAWGIQRVEGVRKPVFASLTAPNYDVIHVGAGVRNLHLPEGHRDRYLHMLRAELKEAAADMMYRATVAVARKAGLYDEKNQCIDHEQITGFFPHQANYAMIQPLAKDLGIPNHKLAQTVKRHGNTGSASIPLAMWHAHKTGELQDGTALLVGFGAGLGAIAGVIDVRQGAAPTA